MKPALRLKLQIPGIGTDSTVRQLAEHHPIEDKPYLDAQD